MEITIKLKGQAALGERLREAVESAAEDLVETVNSTAWSRLEVEGVEFV